MNWEAEIEHIKGLVVWVVLGTILVVNSSFVSEMYFTNNHIGELLMLNMTLLGWFLIGWGVLSFVLNTASLMVAQKHPSKE